MAVDRYELGRLFAEVNLTSGRTSDARLLDTAQGKYILRRLSGRNQAQSEYRIAQALQGEGICPDILQTRGGQGWFESGKSLYNLQPFIASTDEPSRGWDYARLGSLTGRLHAGLRELTLAEQPDRFDLQVTWRRVKEAQSQAFLADTMMERLHEAVEECVCLTQTEDPVDWTYIHGDLGKWNLVVGQEGIHIIDFGEVRRGNPHLDLAALLTSTLDARDKQTPQHLLAYVEAYALHRDGFCSRTLAQQIRLWNVRGAAALLDHVGYKESSVEYVKRLLDQGESWAQLLT
ncbi:hypothetical protein B9G55_19975 [Saccharibacillus sp. O16]|nr:hypothetical protein B9G55_19975 [Saccharibacillus sp. O16]